MARSSTSYSDCVKRNFIINYPFLILFFLLLEAPNILATPIQLIFKFLFLHLLCLCNILWVNHNYVQYSIAACDTALHRGILIPADLLPVPFHNKSDSEICLFNSPWALFSKCLHQCDFGEGRVRLDSGSKVHRPPPGAQYRKNQNQPDHS